MDEVIRSDLKDRKFWKCLEIFQSFEPMQEHKTDVERNMMMMI